MSEQQWAWVQHLLALGARSAQCGPGWTSLRAGQGPPSLSKAGLCLHTAKHACLAWATATKATTSLLGHFCVQKRRKALCGIPPSAPTWQWELRVWGALGVGSSEFGEHGAGERPYAGGLTLSGPVGTGQGYSVSGTGLPSRERECTHGVVTRHQ